MKNKNLANAEQLQYIEELKRIDVQTGVLNIAPIKISGQYKIVIALDGKLYLDDYCGRRVPIDLNTPFLHQVSNFLSVGSVLVNSDSIKYGGYENSGIKTYHIPLYFGDYNNEKLPRFFCVAHVPNETIDNTKNKENNRRSTINIYRYGELLRVVDFEKIGITKIFEEVISEQYFNYPVYFNFEDNNVKIFGQGINEGYPVVKTIDITNNMANQTYIDVFDNRILNEFVENNIFFPRFLNIELEFEFSSEYIPYHNFHGLISYTNEYKEYGSKIFDKQDIYGYAINLLDNKSNWKQIKIGDTLKNSEPIPENTYDFVINEVEEQPLKFRFKTSSCLPYDKIEINIQSSNEEIYTIESNDIRSEDLFTNWYRLCEKFTNQSNRELIFEAKKIDKYTVEISITTDNKDYLGVSVIMPNYYEDLDLFDIIEKESQVLYNSFKFQNNRCVNLVYGNQYTDQILCNIFKSDFNDVRIDNCLIPNFNDTFYTFILIKYNGFINIYFEPNNSEFDSKIINKQSVLHLDTFTKENKPLFLYSIPYLTTYDVCKSDKLYDIKKYKDLLKQRFEPYNNPVFKKALEQFNENSITNYEYVDYQSNEDKQQLNQDLTNEANIVDLKFKSVGQTAYNTVNLLNIDEQFWSQNGCPDIQKHRQDDLKFAWFSVLDNGIETYRYCRIQSITNYKFQFNTVSRLIRVSDSLCETIYLGVKYQLPIQYENYCFAVMLDCDNQNYDDLTYNIIVDNLYKQIILVLHKYIDFTDLIRGGNPKAKSVFDIGLLYNITNSSNSSSDNISAFKTCGLLLEPYYNGQIVGSDSKITNLPLFEGKPQKDWIVTKNNKQYFCVRRDLIAAAGTTNDLRLLFELGDYPDTPTNECYVYSKCEITDPITGKKEIKQYKSVTIKLCNIVELTSDYLWCENIKVKFFDSDKIYVQNVNDELGTEIEYYRRDTFTQYSNNRSFDFSKNKWNSHSINRTETGKTLVEIYSKTFDFKEYYFEITQVLKDNEFGKQQLIELNKFTFDSGFFKDRTPEELNMAFKGSEHPDSFIISESGLDGKFEREEANIYYSKRTLFDYNQLWLLIQNMLKFNLLFKYQTTTQLQQFTDDFTVAKLIEATKLPLPILENNNEKNVPTNKYLKVNIVDISRNTVIWDISKILGNTEKKIVEINRHSGPYFPHFDEIDIENYIDFQLNKYKKFGTVMNMYDKNYGNLILNEIENIEYPYDISATCLWNELHGNIISTLFCFEREFVLEYNFNEFNDTINYRDLLIRHFIYEDLIITDSNSKYLESINKNIRDFTVESFVDNLLNKYYKLESISNELDERIYFWKTKDTNVIQFKNPNIYSSDVLMYSKLKFKFSRK